MIKLHLQRFSEMPTGSMDAGMDAGAAAQAQDQGMDPQAGAAGGETFEELIKGRYKNEYQQAVQKAIGQRFKNQKDMQQQYAPIMQALGQKYGRDPKDVEGISKLLTDDDSLYAEEANRLGLPVSAVKTMKKLEAENARMKQAQQESQEDMALRQHFQRITNQAEELKGTFPSFDLMQEMKNPRFARMTSPQVGMSVKDAFYAIHGEEIQRQSMQYAAQQAGQRLAASVQAGASRPRENALGSNMPVQMGVDVAHMSKEARAAYRQRIHAGETGIDFKNKL